MKDPVQPERRGGGPSNAETATAKVERRAGPRKHFVAEAQIIELASGVKISARSCDLVANGCYVDTLIPFPVGTIVRIQLKKGEIAIEANGKVVYESKGLGMGITFHDLTPEGRAAVDKWLSEQPGKPEPFETRFPQAEPRRPTAIGRPQAAEFVELVQMLQKKGILTKAEAAGLLKEPFDV